MVKDARKALQFATKKDATAAAVVIGWPKRSPYEAWVMGFRLYVLSDDHCSFLTATEYSDLATARAAAEGR